MITDCEKINPSEYSKFVCGEHEYCKDIYQDKDGYFVDEYNNLIWKVRDDLSFELAGSGYPRINGEEYFEYPTIAQCKTLNKEILHDKFGFTGYKIWSSDNLPRLLRLKFYDFEEDKEKEVRLSEVKAGRRETISGFRFLAVKYLVKGANICLNSAQ